MNADTGKTRAGARRTGEGRLPGDPTPREIVARTIRVDHAGEYGAKRIYQGQIDVLRGTKWEPLIRHMQEQEQVHLDTFSRLIPERRVRPTALQPLWNVAGFALGAATALMSEQAALACTDAVETEIDRHYADQLAEIGEDDPELAADILEFQAEELEHRDSARTAGAANAIGYPILTATIRAGCRLAIELSKRI